MDAQSSHFRSLYHLEEEILVGEKSEINLHPKMKASSFQQNAPFKIFGDFSLKVSFF